MKALQTAGLSLLIASAVVVSAYAHHSAAGVDRTRTVTTEGIVKEFKWANPHAWLEVEAPNAKGGTDLWNFEMTSPTFLVRAGWKANTVKAGDKVTVVARPMKNGDPGGLFVSITLPSGQVLTQQRRGEAVESRQAPLQEPAEGLSKRLAQRPRHPAENRPNARCADDAQVHAGRRGAALAISILGCQQSTSTPEGLTPKQVRSRLLEELRPVGLKNCTLGRFGSLNDGGYLLCENLIEGVASTYSYSVGSQDDFACELSARYRLPVHRYDCSDSAPPTCDPVDHIHNACPGPKGETVQSRLFDTLPNQISANGDTGKRLIVTMDVEGAKWEALMATPDAVLERNRPAADRIPRCQRKPVSGSDSETQTTLPPGQPEFQQPFVHARCGAASSVGLSSALREQADWCDGRRGRPVTRAAQYLERAG